MIQAIRTAALAGGLVLAALPLPAADVTGTWDFQVELSIGSGNPAFTFEQKGEELSGTYKGLLGELKVRGTVKGDRIEFSFDFEYSGESGTAHYRGTIESADSMKGEVDYAGQATGTFTAKKRQ
jgi:hypothetical protein